MRIVRRLAHALVIVLTLVVGAAAAAIIVSQTAWFKNWLRGYIVAQANQYLNGTLSIERLGGNLFFGVELENVGVSMDGSAGRRRQGSRPRLQRLSDADRAGPLGRQHPPEQAGGLSAPRRRYLVAQPAGQEAGAGSGSRGPGAPDLDRRHRHHATASVVIDEPVGTSGVDVPKRFDHLDAKLSFKYEPVHYSIEITHLSFRGSEPALGAQRAVGRRRGAGTTRSSSRSWRCGRRRRRCRWTARCSTI